MAKKLKKAILAGLTAYAASKMLGKGRLTAEQAAAGENANIKAALVDAADAGTKFPSKKGHPGGWNWEKGFSSPPNPKKWWEFWKKMGGSVHAKSGQMIKAKQGTYAREDESLGMRLGKGKGTAKKETCLMANGATEAKTGLNQVK